MIMINTKTHFGLEGVTYKYAGFILGVHPQTISNWGKVCKYKEYKDWELYYDTRRIKQGTYS